MTAALHSGERRNRLYSWRIDSAGDVSTARCAAPLNVPPALLTRVRQELATIVPQEAKTLLTSAASVTSFLKNEREFLTEVVAVIETHAGYMKETLQ